MYSLMLGISGNVSQLDSQDSAQIRQNDIDRGSIVPGQSTRSALSAGTKDRWTFEGEAGQWVTVTMTAENNGFYTSLEIISPNGFLVGCQLNSSIGPVMLPLSSTYSVIAASLRDFNGGAYTLTVDLTPAPNTNASAAAGPQLAKPWSWALSSHVHRS